MVSLNKTGPGFWSRWIGRAWDIAKNALAMPPDHGVGTRRRRLRPVQSLEERCLLSATPVGAQFRVNTFTQHAQQTFPQTPQAVAMNPSTGAFVVAWSSQGQNGGAGWDVYFQRYNAAGVAQGAETLVDTPVNGVNQQYASVAMAANGSFVITWSGNQAGHWNIYAQRFNASGVAQGSVIQVSTPTNNDQEYSTVAMDANGNFVIAWTGQQSGNLNTYAEAFNASGTPQTGVFGVSTPISGQDQGYADVAMNANGNFVITWSGHQSGHWSVYAQEYAPSAIPVGSIFQVSTNATDDQEYSTAAMDANGNFVITWSGHQGGHWNIYAQSYLANGTAVGTNFQVNPSTGNDQEFSTVAMQPNGNYLVTWSSNNQDGSGWGIYAQAYNNAGSAQGSEFLVNTYTQNNQQYSSVAMADSGQAVVVWSSANELPGDAWGVYARQYVTSNIIVTPTGGLATTSSGGTATFQVVLAQAPLVAVTIPWTSSNTNEGTVTASTTFNLLDWNIPQTVTITGANDGVSTGNINYQISGGPATALLDPNYQGVLAPMVFVTNIYGVVAPGVTVSPTSITTSDSGATANFTVVLNTAPADPVTITLTNGNPVAGSLSQTSLSFDSTNWNVAQTVTVTGLNDNITTPSQNYQITGSVTSTDGNYNGQPITPVTVTNMETGITITGNSFLIAEDNSVVRVNSLTGAVIATYATGVANDGAVFGPDGSLYVADYNNNQILHYGADGTLLSSFGSAQLISPQGLSFGPDGNLYVTNTNGPNNGFVDEFNATGTFLGTFITAGSGGLSNAKAIVWGPDGNAYVSSYDNSEVLRYNGTTGAFMNVFATGAGGFEGITFGPDNNLYAASYGNNAVYSYNGTTGASLGAFVSGVTTPYGLSFDPSGNLEVSSRSTGQVKTFSGTTGAFLGNLITGLINPSYVTPTSSLVTTQAGASATFSVVLDSQPSAPVTINLTNGYPAAGSLSQTSLSFNSSNWNVAQTVTVTGLDDFANFSQTYQITGTATSMDANYNGMAISPIAVTNMAVAQQPGTSVYGQAVTFGVIVSAVPPASGTPTGTVTFIDGTTNLATVTLSGGQASFTTSALSVGSHNISAYYSGDSHFAPSSGFLLTQTVTPATLIVTANDAGKVYAQANPAFTDTITGFVNSENASVISGNASLTTAATASSGVGNYTIVAAQGSLSAANYMFIFSNGTLTISPATLTVTATDANKSYGQANPAFTDTITGFVNNDTASVVSGTPSLTTAATASSGVGNYTITAAQGSLSANNYNFSFVNGTLTVTPATLTVTATDANKAYGQANPAFTDTITGFVNSENASVVSGTPSLTTAATSSSGVGSYTITAAQGSLSANNYNFSFVNGTLTITPVTLTVTAMDANKVYGQANPAFTDTITGFVNHDTASVVSGTASLTTAATSSSGVGSYTITAAQGSLSANNYNFSFVNGTLTITPVTLTVTAMDANKVYGQANPAFTDTITGFVNHDTASVVSGNASLTTLATASSGVGSYTITAAQGSLSANNYNFSFVNGTLTITPVTLTVTAMDANKVYGQANPAFTDTITGFVNHDTASVVSGTASLTTLASASSGVGTYTITAAQGSLSANNYSFAFVNGTLTIVPATLTVTANDAGRLWGQANPAFTDTITGFVNGDNAGVLSGNPSLTTTATPSSPAGVYTIMAARGSLSAANYAFSFNNGTLTIASPNVVVLPAPTGVSTSSSPSVQASTSEGKNSSSSTQAAPIAISAVATNSREGETPRSQNSTVVLNQDASAELARRVSIQWVALRQTAARSDIHSDHTDNFVPPAPPKYDFGAFADAKAAGDQQRLQTSVGTADYLLAALDEIDAAGHTQETAETMGIFVSTGLIASAGYMLLNTRTGFWLLSLMAARPLWKQFDPLEILYAWEDHYQENTETKEETLLSLVD